MRVIIPRECPDPRTDHCIADIGDGLSFPKPRCQFCGRFMSMDEAINFDEGGD